MTNDSSIWIPTYSGRRVDIMNPDPDAICLMDIAHHLANINRYLGATIRPYSVGEHSVRLAHAGIKILPGMDAVGRELLMHDGHEAYVCDLPRMIVMALGSDYTSMRDRVDLAVRSRFNMHTSIHPRMWELDKAIGRVEIKYLYRATLDTSINGSVFDSWSIDLALEDFDRGCCGGPKRWGWDWQKSKRMFLEAAAEYEVC